MWVSIMDGWFQPPQPAPQQFYRLKSSGGSELILAWISYTSDLMNANIFFKTAQGKMESRRMSVKIHYFPADISQKALSL